MTGVQQQFPKNPTNGWDALITISAFVLVGFVCWLVFG